MQAFSSANGKAAAVTTTDKYKSSFVYDANGNILSLERNGNNTANLLMDNFTYSYKKDGNGKILSNRLLKVSDSQSNKSLYGNDFDQNSSTLVDYSYDAIGNLIRDKNDSIASIKWDTRGKITSITTERKFGRDLEFQYDSWGNRIAKISKRKFNGSLMSEENWDYTYYVRDAQGNVMATNEMTVSSTSNGFAEKLTLQEWDLYGSSRLGIQRPNGVVILGTSTFTNGGTASDGRYIRDNYFDRGIPATINQFPNGNLGKTYQHTLGFKNYELTNHLGNVMAVVNDRRLLVSPLGPLSVGSSLQPEVLSYTDYYPFGSVMPGRSYNSQNYDYGFNGKRNDNEVYGSANFQDYGLRGYDTRLGRFISTDPLTRDYPWYTPYQFAGNTPIRAIDLDGGEEKIVTRKWSTHPDGELFVISTSVSINQRSTKAQTTVIDIYQGNVNISVIDHSDEVAKGMIPSSAYNYKDLPFQKLVDDGKYLFTGFLSGNDVPLDQQRNLWKRDAAAPDAKQDDEIAEDLAVLFPIFGSKGSPIQSKTVYKFKGSKARVDIENPNPGQRAAQIHFQDKNNVKYMYNNDLKKFFGKNAKTGAFDMEAPKQVNDLLKDPKIQGAINKALNYLGEK